MARTSDRDPLDKFRFLVTILSSGSVTTVSNGGFSEVILPKVNITEIKYRENVHGATFIKKPGLANYEPVTLRRGVIQGDRDLYDWFKEVFDYSSSTNKYMEALSSFAVIPVQNPGFRRDIVISAVTRDGKTPKHWVIYNAMPTSYTPGSLNASEDGKMIEELAFTYEGFVEVLADSFADAINKVADEAQDATNKALATNLAGSVTSGIIGKLV